MNIEDYADDLINKFCPHPSRFINKEEMLKEMIPILKNIIISQTYIYSKVRRLMKYLLIVNYNEDDCQIIHDNILNYITRYHTYKELNKYFIDNIATIIENYNYFDNDWDIILQ